MISTLASLALSKDTIQLVRCQARVCIEQVASALARSIPEMLDSSVKHVKMALDEWRHTYNKTRNQRYLVWMKHPSNCLEIDSCTACNP